MAGLEKELLLFDDIILEVLKKFDSIFFKCQLKDYVFLKENSCCSDVASHIGDSQFHLMSLQLFILLLFFLLNIVSVSMHGLPCASLGNCFGNPSDVNTDPAPSQEQNNSITSRNNHGLPAAEPVISQPEASGSPLRQYSQPQRTVSCISTHSTRTRSINGTKTNSNCHLQDKDAGTCLESTPAYQSPSESSYEEDVEFDLSREGEQNYPQIPRPSIIIRKPKVKYLVSVSVFNYIYVMNHPKSLKDHYLIK